LSALDLECWRTGRSGYVGVSSNDDVVFFPFGEIAAEHPAAWKAERESGVANDVSWTSVGVLALEAGDQFVLAVETLKLE
jgi:hypothetical protein